MALGSSRLFFSSMLATAALVGCLFPSFDKFSGTGGAPDFDPEADPDPNDPGRTRDGSADRGDAPSAPAQVIVCNDLDSGICRVGLEYCCTTVGGPECRENGGVSPPSTCPIQNFGNGKSIFCDGHEDCAQGEVCCFTSTATDDIHAKCTTTCAGTVLCNGPQPQCPSEKSCSGILAGTKMKVCQ